MREEESREWHEALLSRRSHGQIIPMSNILTDVRGQESKYGHNSINLWRAERNNARKVNARSGIGLHARIVLYQHFMRYLRFEASL